MPIKKSELYSSLWKSCDELRGGMDASQYKDYVLVMLFLKYVSDKYAGMPYAPIKVPEGSSFRDMVAMKGDKEIGDKINKFIIRPIAEQNKLTGTIDVADFNSSDKLGDGKERMTKLTNLVAIFENPQLDFSKNKAEGDDILGDAYEYLMRHFATESGKSKGQFYTPAEVSRVMASIIGINFENSTAQTTVYDPTCGSASLLLKIAAAAGRSISMYGQEMDVATAALARMNMILHNNPTAIIHQGNTLANPLFLDANGTLKTFDYVVANPPFSYKSWSNGVDPVNDEFGRFHDFGIPPAKNGDYAFLLHIFRSLKSTGKGAVILPHGVLFRGNTEADIRRAIVRRGFIRGVIGLPANLFYGTGIPACIIVLDKEKADSRNGIFMIDASKGFEKDGNKNRLREQDIHKIVDTFNNQIEIPKYSRLVTLQELKENEYNLNIPRYIDSQEAEDIQDIDAHLRGGIPNTDIEALGDYWKVYPSLKTQLFANNDREGYQRLAVEHDAIKNTIFDHPEFGAYARKLNDVFAAWRKKFTPVCNGINGETKPKHFIHDLGEGLLESFDDLDLIDAYDVYQHLMSYWIGTMQDDVYLIVSDGWLAGREITWDKKEFEGTLVPKGVIVSRFFQDSHDAVVQMESELESLNQKLEELIEENSGDDGYFADMDKVNRGNVSKRYKEIKKDNNAKDERAVLEQYLQLKDDADRITKEIKQAAASLDKRIQEKYAALTEDEIRSLLVEEKWTASIEQGVQSEMQRISQRLTGRIRELAERYQVTLPSLNTTVVELEGKVSEHLSKMGYTWK